MDQPGITAEFVKAELHTGITFADLALTAKYPDRRERNKVNARKAYDTALRYMDAISSTPETTAKLQDLLEHLRTQLKELGEPV